MTNRVELSRKHCLYYSVRSTTLALTLTGLRKPSSRLPLIRGRYGFVLVRFGGQVQHLHKSSPEQHWIATTPIGLFVPLIE